jgi:hypothetical protein
VQAVLKGSLGRIQEHFPVFDKDEAFSRFKKRGNEQGNEKFESDLFTLT